MTTKHDATNEAANPRIVGVSAAESRQPLRQPFRTALREVTELEVITATLAWSDGSTTSGAVSPTPPITGETTGSITAAITGPLAEALEGMALDEHAVIFQRLAGAMRANTTAKCALDLALHEAIARPAGGLRAWLGAPRSSVRTDVTIGLGDPEGMAASARARASEGFDVLKLKVGGDDVDLDVARIAAVASAAPGVTLRVDANQAWTAKHALGVLDRVESMGLRVELLEQPVPAADLAAMAAITARTSIPVMADESVHSASDVVRVAEAGAADIVNVKLAKCGGLDAARGVIATARACGLEVLMGTMLEPATAVAAALSLAATLPTRRAHDLDAGLWTLTSAPLDYQPPNVRAVA